MLGRRNFLQVIGLGALLSFASDKTYAAQSAKKEIHLIDVFIAGYQYYEGMKEEVVQSLQIDDSVVLKREPKNRYDENAIEVYTRSGHKLGYLPRSDNTVLAAMADQDVELMAKLSHIDRHAPPWERAALSVCQVIER